MNHFNFRLQNVALSAVLLIAAVAHFLYPELFLPAMPPYIPWHQEVIFWTGALEIIFAFGLLYRRITNITSKLLALYFVAILPAHFHVSMHKITMFGVSNPYLLWGRTLFQSVLIFWAFKCQHKKDLS